jgi:ERCC4-type nuclease
MLLIDTREPPNIIAAVINEASKHGIDTDVRPLQTCDFVWEEESIGIERKTVEDLARSVNSQRIKHQLARMEVYTFPYVFISGPLQDTMIYGDGKPWMWTLTRHHATTMTISAMFKSKVIQFINDESLIHGIFSIRGFTIAGPGKTTSMIRKSDAIEPNFDMLMRITGIGKKSAYAILKDYPKFQDFLDDYSKGRLQIKLRKPSIEFLNRIISEQESYF